MLCLSFESSFERQSLNTILIESDTLTLKARKYCGINHGDQSGFVKLKSTGMCLSALFDSFEYHYKYFTITLWG